MNLIDFSDSAAGTSVQLVEARDPDSSAQLRYSLHELSLQARDRNGQPIDNPGPVSVSIPLLVSLINENFKAS